jgi:hypothetical protein
MNCWRTFKLLRNGPQTNGGKSHVLVQDNDNQPNQPAKYTRIQSKPLLDETLLQSNINHFQQAKDTPFTSPSIIEYIGEDGFHNNVHQILNGFIRQDLPTLVTRILHKFKSKSQSIPITFTFEDMCSGYMKWREATKTSPSGKHLGLYKALVKTKYIQCKSEHDEELIRTASDCLEIQLRLMTLAITHCHTYQRWKQVHNFLLEKTPGFPLISKLCVIHIYEADWSLIQKFFVSYKINNIACRAGKVP